MKEPPFGRPAAVVLGVGGSGNPPPVAIDFGLGLLVSNQAASGFVLELDNDGKALSNRMFEGGQGFGLALDSMGELLLSGIAAAGADLGGEAIMSNGLFVAKYDAAHALVSIKVANAGDFAVVAASPAGHAIVAGAFTLPLDFGTGTALTSKGGSDIFVGDLGP